MKATVLVVDDRVRPRRALVSELEDAGFGVVEAGDGEQAWECFCRAEPDVVVTDLVMPHVDGHELLGRIRARSDVPVILFSAQASMAAAVAALKAGADDFVSSSDVAIDDLVGLVTTAAEGRKHAGAAAGLESRIAGSSPAIERVRARVTGLAPLPTPVLVIGEEGTGRDTVVRAIHELGPNAEGRLVAVDCGSFAPERGLTECRAVYLDGVERLSPAGQDYWARRLTDWEGRQFRSGPRVFASSVPIFRSAAQVPFHPYLRQLLMRFPLELPPLRERVEDVPELADALVRAVAADMNRKTSLSPSAREFLGQQVWPRNLKQLARVLERAVAFSCERSIRRDELEELVADLDDSLESIRKSHGLRERDDLLEALQTTGGNVSRAAEVMGRSRGAVYRLIDKYEIPLSRSRR